MKILIIRDINEELVDVNYSYKDGTLIINFSPDFEGKILGVYDLDKLRDSIDDSSDSHNIEGMSFYIPE